MSEREPQVREKERVGNTSWVGVINSLPEHMRQIRLGLNGDETISLRRRKEILELAQHESSVEESEWDRQLRSSYARGVDKQCFIEGFTISLSLLVIGGIEYSALLASLGGHYDTGKILAGAGVLFGYACIFLGGSLADRLYSPLRNNDGLDYFDLRERAIEDGRIKG